MKIINLLLILMLIFMVSCSSQVKSGSNSSDNMTEVISDNDDTEDVVKDNIPKITSKNSDLKPNIMSSRLYPALNEVAKLTFEVKNDGIAKIQNPFNYSIEITRDGVYVLQKTNVSNVKVSPDKTETIEKLKYTFNEYGEYKVKLNLDLNNDIDELREENNEKIITIYVNEKKESTDDSKSFDKSADNSDEEGCSDTDGGKDFGTVGTCTDDNFVNGRKDVCADDSRLMEAYCINSRCSIEIKECEGICKNGKCI